MTSYNFIPLSELTGLKTGGKSQKAGIAVVMDRIFEGEAEEKHHPSTPLGRMTRRILFGISENEPERITVERPKPKQRKP